MFCTVVIPIMCECNDPYLTHDFDYAQKYNQKIQLWLQFDQPNVCSCPTILTAIDICLGQKRNKDKAERKKQ